MYLYSEVVAVGSSSGSYPEGRQFKSDPRDQRKNFTYLKIRTISKYVVVVKSFNREEKVGFVCIF